MASVRDCFWTDETTVRLGLNNRLGAVLTEIGKEHQGELPSKTAAWVTQWFRRGMEAANSGLPPDSGNDMSVGPLADRARLEGWVAWEVAMCNFDTALNVLEDNGGIQEGHIDLFTQTRKRLASWRDEGKASVLRGSLDTVMSQRGFEWRGDGEQELATYVYAKPE